MEEFSVIKHELVSIITKCSGIVVFSNHHCHRHRRRHHYQSLSTHGIHKANVRRMVKIKVPMRSRIILFYLVFTQLYSMTFARVKAGLLK